MKTRAPYLRIVLLALALRRAPCTGRRARQEEAQATRAQEGEQPARDRAPRRRRLRARAHAPGVRARDQARRRLHRAGPRGDEGRRADRAPRAEHRRLGPDHDRDSTNVGEHPEFAIPRDDAGRSTACRRRASSPRTSRSPRSRRSARGRRAAGARQQFNGQFKIPTFQEIIELAKRRVARSAGAGSASTPRRSTRRSTRAIGLPLEGRLVKALKKNGLNSTQRAGVHPVVRAVAT